MTDKVLLTIDREHVIWVMARGDVNAAYLPFACREIVAGNVAEATVTLADWSKLQAFINGLPGGRESLPLASDAPPPAPVESSERAIAARKLADIVHALGAVSPFGGDVLRAENGRYYAVPFAVGREFAGLVLVYSVGYVRVSFNAETPKPPPEGLARSDVRTYASVEDAAKFLSLCLHGRRYAEALAIPQRVAKRKPGRGATVTRSKPPTPEPPGALPPLDARVLLLCFRCARTNGHVCLDDVCAFVPAACRRTVLRSFRRLAALGLVTRHETRPGHGYFYLSSSLTLFRSSTDAQ